jgi:hypothetical protein
MKIKVYFILLCFLSAGLFNSCSKEKTFDCIKSTGDIKKEDRYFDNFSKIYVDDNINVILVQSLPGKIIVEAGENLLPKIKSEQDGSSVRIQNKNTCNWVRSYKKAMNIYVGADQVKNIILEGYGTISNGETIKTDTLGITSLTFGEIDLTIESNFIGFIADDHTTLRIRGKSNSVAGSCFKNSLTEAKDLHTNWFILSNYSLIDASIYSDSLVQAEVGGTGNINCYGHPPLVEYKHPSGSGSLLFP